MSLWKNSLIDAYRYSTWPWRQAVLNRMKKNETVPVMILFYHRVADEFPNPWTISQNRFRQQVDWLQQNFDLVSLDETRRRIEKGNRRPAVAITFDDGYADNCSFALPLLIERNIPVTYFVTTYHTTHDKPFPHDVQRKQPLPTNSIESLRALCNAGVEIAGHTRNHLDLGDAHDDDTIYDEVIAATREMESMIDAPIRYFAFPFGQKTNLNPKVFDLLADHGFAGVCSAYGGINRVGGDGFHLQRIHGDPNMARLKNWLSWDPRVARIERYQWQTELQKVVTQEMASREDQRLKTDVRS